MTDAPETPEGLRPANENPWYILMTLYGEQEGEEIDGALHEKNRRAWNAWSGQALSAEQRATAAKSSKIDVAELGAWEDLSKEIKAQFAAEYKRRNPEVGTVPDLPKATDLIDMSSTTFAKPVVLQQAVFASSALFEVATFTQDAWFDQAMFTQGANFVLAKFTQLAIFVDATFTQSADFHMATFGDGADFLWATFARDALFYFAKFMQSARFDSATFMQDARFDSATFTQIARFNSATFTQGAQFHSATFTQAAQFPGVTFSGFAYFTETRFGSSAEKPCLPDFTDCQFEKPTSFRQALFLDGYPDFSGAVLHDKTSFTARMEPTSSKIARDKDLEGRTFWPRKTKQDPVSARESCATIRHVLTQQGLPEDAHFFFRREMRFASQIGSCLQRLPYRLFGWLSDFGYSIQRPLWWLAGIWFVGMSAFWAVFSFPGGAPALTESDLGTAAALSFSNLFPLFGFGRVFLSDVLTELPRWAQVLSGAQTVLSLPLLFFLGLALRQRFRLR